MKAELLEQLRKITPEEQEILNGRKQINQVTMGLFFLLHQSPVLPSDSETVIPPVGESLLLR